MQDFQQLSTGQQVKVKFKLLEQIRGKLLAPALAQPNRFHAQAGGHLADLGVVNVVANFVHPICFHAYFPWLCYGILTSQHALRFVLNVSGYEVETMILSDVVAIIAIAISICSLVFARISAQRGDANIKSISSKVKNISSEVMERIENIHIDERRLSLIKDFINASQQIHSEGRIEEYAQDTDHIIELGDKVRIRFLDDESFLREVVISEYRNNPKRGVISVDTPLGGVLIGKQLYDVTEFMINTNIRKIRIEHIKKEGV